MQTINVGMIVTKQLITIGIMVVMEQKTNGFFLTKKHVYNATIYNG